MADPVSILEETAAPTDRPRETLDVRDLPPPQPLQKTLESLPEIGDGVVLIQYNDRAPQHLFPKLEDRGYVYETVEDECVVTVIWKE